MKNIVVIGDNTHNKKLKEVLKNIKTNNKPLIIIDSISPNDIKEKIKEEIKEPECGDLERMTKTQLKYYARKYKSEQDYEKRNRLNEIKKELKLRRTNK